MLKLLALIEILIFVTSVSLTSLQDDIKQLKLMQIEQQTIRSAQASRVYQNHHKNSTAIDESITTSYRLPNNTWPLHYDIYLRTSVHTGHDVYNGVVRINIDVLENTNSITLHSRLHLIQGLNLFTVNGSVFDTILTFTYDSDLEFLTILSSTELVAGQELIIEVTYVGILNDFSGRGFIINSYEDPATGETVWMAQSHLQPVNTRHAFPSYDEPRYRQTIALRIEHHESYRAVSTMPVSTIEETPYNFVITSFVTTPVMPIIILTFSVNRLDFVSTTDNSTPAREWRVFARPDAIAAGQANSALEVGVAFLQGMETIFNISDIMPKSDQIAMPQFIANGAGNWGFICVRESILLRTNDDPREQHLREMRLAHEYSHIFFGNLVSAESFSYIWLNEGFATLYENILNDHVFPEKRQWERFLIDFFDASMLLDVFDFVDPMNNYAETRNQIRARFNFITYQKAALVLRMFQEALTDATWTKGLRYFLLERRLQSATPDDVFDGLQQAFDEDFPGRNVDVGAMMNPWLNLRGYPVVTVSRTEQGLLVTQEGFRTSHDELFNIPLNYATASVPNFNETIVDIWLTTREMQITLENASRPWTNDDWIIFNLRDTGYYVTNYDDALWNLIIDALLNDQQRDEIHFLNRGTLFADLHRFIDEDYDIRTTLYLDLIQSLEFEDHPHVWVRSNMGLEKFERRLRGTSFHQLFRDFLNDILDIVYSETEVNDPFGRNIINRWSCISGVESCLTDSLASIVEAMENDTSSEFDLRCNGLMTANETVWMHFFDAAMEETSDRLSFLRDLLCTQDVRLALFYLSQSINTTNVLSDEERQYMLTLACSENEVSYNTMIDFIAENHQDSDEILPLEEIIHLLALATNTEDQAERVLDLIRFIPVERNPDRDHFRLLMQRNFDFIERNSDDFNEWFESRAATQTL